MPILTRAQILAAAEKENSKNNNNTNNKSHNDEVIITGTRMERAAGKRVPKPTEFFEIAFPEKKIREPRRRQRQNSDESGSDDDDHSGSSSSSSGSVEVIDGIKVNRRNRRNSGNDEGNKLPPRAARLEFEKRIKRGHLESDIDSSSSSSSSSSSDDDDDDVVEYRPRRRGGGGGKGNKNKNNAKRGGKRDDDSNNNDDDDDNGDQKGIPSPKKRKQADQKNSSKNKRADDDDNSSDDSNEENNNSDDEDNDNTDDEGEVFYDDGDAAAEGVIDHPHPREIERAMNGKLTINAKLADLLEAHRAKLDMLKKDAGDDGPNSSSGNNNKKKNDVPKNIDIVSLDPVSFSDIGGVPDHIVALREMLLLPLTYPHLFSHLGVKPPRGVLFCGPPGNGKTLMARALALECSKAGPGGQPVTFFARKGADIMSKWVGEGERQLSQLFAEARRLQPSIIFFDEIDGLAPVRHMKQESSHASVVSTLLALMDGLDDRGQVVIIGATNRPDTLDPALRRPGRFDRELRFDYPNAQARHHILSIHTKKWNFSDRDLERIAEETHGFAGADLSALCTEASLVALRRFCPHMFVSSQRYDIDATNLSVTLHDFLTAIRSMNPSSHRSRNMTVVMNDTPLRRSLADSTTHDVLVALRRHWHSISDELATVDTADAEASFLKLVRPPPVAGMVHRSALILFTVKSAIPQTSAVEATAACSIDFLGRTFPGSLVVSFNFASGQVAGIEPTLLENETSHQSPDASAFSSSASQSSALSALLSYTMKHRKVILILTGIESLPFKQVAEDHEESDAPLRWMFDSVAHRDTAVIVATSERALQTHGPRMESLFGPTLYSIAARFSSPGVRVGDLEKSLEKVIVPDLCASCIKTLPDAPPVLSAEQIAQRFPHFDEQQQQLSLSRRVALSEEWHKVAYKRTQLRQCLREIVGSLFSKTVRFEMFHGPDLDLVKGAKGNKEIDSLLKKWRRHYSKNPVNLNMVSEKVDKEVYTAVSQFNNDIETICRNIFTFFAMDKASRRYRDRAKQMKEEVLLANYKLNRSIALFCEDHANDTAPKFLASHNNNNNNSKNKIVDQRKQISPSTATRNNNTMMMMLLDEDDGKNSVNNTNSINKNSNEKNKKKKNGDESSSDTDEEIENDNKNRKNSSYRSRSASRKSSTGSNNNPKNKKKSNKDSSSSESESEGDDDDDDENATNNKNKKKGSSSIPRDDNNDGKKFNDDDDDDDDKNLPPFGLKLRATVSENMLAELKQALRQTFKIPAKATFTDPVGLSLNQCEQVLVYEFLQNNDTVKKIRAKIEGTLSSTPPASSSVDDNNTKGKTKNLSSSGKNKIQEQNQSTVTRKL